MMGAHDRNNIPAPVAAATAYPVGLQFDVEFEAFAVRLTTLSNSELRFSIAEGPYARTETVKIVTTLLRPDARTETVKIVTTLLRPGVFIVSWVEASGATVVHVEDFAQGALYSHATLPDGTFLRMQAPIRVVLHEVTK
jgi:hypothetical protein